MTLRSKVLRSLFVVVPLVLAASLWAISQRRPRVVATLPIPIYALALSHDGSMLAAQDQKGVFHLWSRAGNGLVQLQTERIKPPAKGLAACPGNMMFSPSDGTLLASNVVIYSARDIYSGFSAWDVRTHRVEWSLISQSQSFINSFCPSPDGKSVAKWTSGVEVFNIPQVGAVRTPSIYRAAREFAVAHQISDFPRTSAKDFVLPAVLAFSPDHKTLAVAFYSGKHAYVEFWDIAKKHMQSRTSFLKPGVMLPSSWQLQFSPDGRFVALWQYGKIMLWNRGAQVWTMAPTPKTLSGTSLAWMPDSRSLWFGSSSVQQWSVPGLKVLRELPAQSPIAVAGDGKTLAACTRTKAAHKVWLWNIA